MPRERKYWRSPRSWTPVRLDRAGQAAGERAQALGERLVDRLEHPAEPFAVERGACRAVRLGGEEHEVDRADAEGRGGACEQRLELGHDLGRARQRAGRLVEELELGVAAALGQVGAVGRHEQHRGRHEQEAADRARGDHGGDRQREAGVAEGDGPVREQHVDALLRLEPALRDRHGGPDADVGDERGGGHRGEDGQPDDRVERVAHVHEALDHEQRHARAERELREVEEGLEGRDLAVERERHRGADQPGQDELVRRQEQQAGHERKLAERQRVGAPAEVQVHDPALRGREAGGHQPPRHVQLARPCAERLGPASGRRPRRPAPRRP